MGSITYRDNKLLMSVTQEYRKALIVDDEMTNRLILRSLLKKLGYSTVEAENGAAAIEVYEAEHPTIIFMDIMMPVMDGYEATRIIKSAANNTFIPVIWNKGCFCR